MMLTMTANIVATCCVSVLIMAQRVDLSRIRSQRGSIFAVAILTGLERTLTNASLYGISASLKTMLHAFNVPFTVVAAAILGADQDMRSCLFGCGCADKAHRNNALAIGLITVGALSTAFDGTEIQGNWFGVLLQLLS